MPVHGYRADPAERFPDEGRISFELGVCDGPESAQHGLETSKAETEAEFPEAARWVSVNTEPAFFKSVTPRGTFMAWTRGGYYFSAHARSGEDDLDRFMEAFPF